MNLHFSPRNGVKARQKEREGVKSHFRKCFIKTAQYNKLYISRVSEVLKGSCSSDVRTKDCTQPAPPDCAKLFPFPSPPLINSSYALCQRQSRCLSARPNGNNLQQHALISNRDVWLRVNWVKKRTHTHTRRQSITLIDQVNNRLTRLQTQQWSVCAR